MEKRKLITLRIEESLLNKINGMANKSKTDRSKVIRDLLNSSLSSNLKAKHKYTKRKTTPQITVEELIEEVQKEHMSKGNQSGY